MKLYSTAEAASHLGLSLDAVKYHLKHKHLTGQKVGHSLVFTERELDRFRRDRRPVGRPRVDP